MTPMRMRTRSRGLSGEEVFVPVLRSKSSCGSIFGGLDDGVVVVVGASSRSCIDIDSE